MLCLLIGATTHATICNQKFLQFQNFKKLLELLNLWIYAEHVTQLYNHIFATKCYFMFPNDSQNAQKQDSCENNNDCSAFQFMNAKAVWGLT